MTTQGSYKDLHAWQKAMELVLQVYEATRDFPKEELYGLVSQLRRSAVSVPSNIAEGKGRATDKDFLVFLHHARGSLLELETQVLIARKLGFLTSENRAKTLGQLRGAGENAKRPDQLNLEKGSRLTPKPTTKD